MELEGVKFTALFDSGATMAAMNHRTMQLLGLAASITHHEIKLIKFMGERKELSFGIMSP